jgi:hypothetical protein
MNKKPIELLLAVALMTVVSCGKDNKPEQPIPGGTTYE